MLLVCVCVCVSEDVGPTADAPCDNQDLVWLIAYTASMFTFNYTGTEQTVWHLCLHMACNNVGLSSSSQSWHVHLSLLTCSWHGETSHDNFLLHKQHHGWHNHLWISADWQPSSLRSPFTVLLSCLDGFSTPYEILNLHCNVIYIGYSLNQLYFSTHVCAGVFTQSNVQLN